MITLKMSHEAMERVILKFRALLVQTYEEETGVPEIRALGVDSASKDAPLDDETLSHLSSYIHLLCSVLVNALPAARVPNMDKATIHQLADGIAKAYICRCGDQEHVVDLLVSTASYAAERAMHKRGSQITDADYGNLTELLKAIFGEEDLKNFTDPQKKAH